MDRVETAMFIKRKIKKYIKDIKEIDGKVMEVLIYVKENKFYKL